MRMHEILAPIRAHARLAPLDRLSVDGAKILADMVYAMRGADRRCQEHAADCLAALRPRLYDLWDVARAVEPCPEWLKPLAEYGPRH
jgi:hypothetical protein